MFQLLYLFFLQFLPHKVTIQFRSMYSTHCSGAWWVIRFQLDADLQITSSSAPRASLQIQTSHIPCTGWLDYLVSFC